MQAISSSVNVVSTQLGDQSIGSHLGYLGSTRSTAALVNLQPGAAGMYRTRKLGSAGKKQSKHTPRYNLCT